MVPSGLSVVPVRYGNQHQYRVSRCHVNFPLRSGRDEYAGQNKLVVSEWSVGNAVRAWRFPLRPLT